MVVEPNKLTLQSNKGMLKKPAFPGSLKTDFLSLVFLLCSFLISWILPTENNTESKNKTNFVR